MVVVVVVLVVVIVVVVQVAATPPTRKTIAQKDISIVCSEFQIIVNVE